MALFLHFQTGCGGSGSSSTRTGPPSGLKNRAFISNQLNSGGLASGGLNIIDATKDQLSSANVAVGGVPSLMVRSSDKSKTLVLQPASNQIVTVDNAKESVLATTTFAEMPFDAVILSDNNTGYASIRNAGHVSIFDSSKGIVSQNIPIATVNRLVLSHNGKQLLAFSDDSNTMTVIDTSSATATAVPGFDRPVFGVFSSDDARAYIVNCGPECGGARSSITVLNLGNLTLGASVPVSAGTIAALDSSGGNLYVAGTAASGGKLDVVSTSTLTVSRSGIAISDGYHDHVAFAANNKLFIGARTCNNQTTGCLSIVDTSNQSATISPPRGSVTGLVPISGRNVVYVIEGGELRIYSTSTGTLQGTQVDIFGPAFDVLAVDQ